MHPFWLVTADRLGSLLRVVFTLCFFRTVAPHRQHHCTIALLTKHYIVVKGARQLQVIILGMGFEWEASDERDVLRDEIEGTEENEGLD